ncbi:MAG: phage portal protein [Oscillospiraceae bacterium]|nr:phage portal protein [Oscillospiraceae bacterium]
MINLRKIFNFKNRRSMSYDSGRHDRLNRNWVAVNESAETTNKVHRDLIRARSRDLERNSDLMNASVSPWIRNIVGKGYILEAKSKDKEFNDRIEELWRKWCKKDNCDVTGSQSFWEMMRMAVRRKRIDGGILFIKHYTDGGVIPFQILAREVDELDGIRQNPQYEGNRVIGGIEYNNNARAVGYWLKKYDLDGNLDPESIFVPRERVIFYFSKTRPSQLREMPEMSAAIGRIKDANGYVEAVTVKERMAACFGAFVKRNAPTQPGFMGRNPVSSYEDDFDYEDVKFRPGMILELMPGDDIQMINPPGSAESTSEFIKALSRLIFAGQGISYEAGSRDLSQTNYSSARQAVIEDEKTFLPEVDKLKHEILDDIYADFVEIAVLSGVVECKEFWENKDEYLKHQWNRKPKK